MRQLGRTEGSSGAVQTALVVALVILSVAIGWAALSYREPTVPERQVANRPIQVDEDGYVSSQTCAACHPSEYETWYGSFHRTMTQVATSETVRADFDGTRIADVHGRSMLLERRGSQFWAEFDDLDWDGTGTEPPRIKRQVVMITGSHHQQIYWYATGHDRVLNLLPGIYVVAEQRWIPRRTAVLHPPDQGVSTESGHWNAVCIACHTTHGKTKFDTPFLSQPIDTQKVDTTVAEFGISCEACHGPSAEHARQNRSPVRRYWLHLTGRRDPTTVQPALLDPERSSQVCGQCHGIWEFYNQKGERQANSQGLPYRPGDELRDTRFVAQPAKNAEAPAMKALVEQDPEFVNGSFWSDGMVRVSGREYNGLIDSPCFKNATDARRTMSCFSCHTMHKTPDDPRSIAEWADTYQVAAGMDGNQACLQCHETFKTNLTAHTKHKADSTGSDCYNCHMPFTTYGLLKALRSHQVSSPSAAASLQTGRPNACNLCHLDRTLGWTSDTLGKWYSTPKPELSEDEQRVSASLLWLLRGDAGQRALVAWSMGWQPAQQTSGTSWMAPYLAELLNDPYEAVRFVTYRSLRSLPGFAGLEYDFVAPPKQRFAAGLRALEIWRRGSRLAGRRTDPELLFDAEGTLQAPRVGQLLRQRNNRHMFLRE